MGNHTKTRAAVRIVALTVVFAVIIVGLGSATVGSNRSPIKDIKTPPQAITQDYG